ncbi:hypothetical protein IF1G_00067 [Cordyceps javanica]|uniref:Uncharacterized protein n=1 Tax=Cordyceps javanica TaxID=43265 RepID=A0A545VEJ8_9HYPO|nr:hypothetical protein IF1G_00067 [Cordyceps javanica]
MVTVFWLSACRQQRMHFNALCQDRGLPPAECDLSQVNKSRAVTERGLDYGNARLYVLARCYLSPSMSFGVVLRRRRRSSRVSESESNPKRKLLPDTRAAMNGDQSCGELLRSIRGPLRLLCSNYFVTVTAHTIEAADLDSPADYHSIYYHSIASSPT